MEKVSKSKYDMCLGMKYFHKILLHYKITKFIYSQALLHLTKKTCVDKINERIIWKK